VGQQHPQHFCTHISKAQTLYNKKALTTQSMLWDKEHLHHNFTENFKGSNPVERLGILLTNHIILLGTIHLYKQPSHLLQGLTVALSTRTLG
jgi:hypothetical protein